ncbi:MAG: CoA transferase [Ardenticatenaceae bacterium]|nr:CoA transferase [Ardenticatenaceae bacterium]
MSTSALEGIRVIEFGHVWAAPYCGAVLADIGAEVIKVESRERLDVHRKQGPFPGKERGINRSAVWNAQNRGKFGCTINLREARGVELAKRLVARSDVVLENYRPGVMKKLGLDYPALKLVKPDIIMVSMTGFGQTGPFSNYAAYGPMLEAFSGVASITGYPDGPPACIGESYPDPLVGLYGVFAILVALYHRVETGQGQYIDLSQLEAMICHLPEAILDFVLNGRTASSIGNRDEVMAPHGCYWCQGEDKWVAIAISTDAEWESFCRAIGSPDWCRDERFSDGFGRWRNQTELDERVESWTKQHTTYEVMHILQSAGIRAGPSLNIEELLHDPHLRSRKVFVEVEHPEIGTQLTYAPTWKLHRTPGEIQRHAPLLGGDNHYVFGEVLGLSGAEIAQLIDDRVLY